MERGKGKGSRIMAYLKQLQEENNNPFKQVIRL